MPYALNLLSAIINQFMEHEKALFQDKKEEFFGVFSLYFRDLVYNCLIILRQHSLSASDAYVNQTGEQNVKIGIHRVRAIEQLRTLFVALGRQGSIKESPLLSELMRRKVIETMLFMIKTFPYCSISHQQAILILNSLKEAFDAQDLATLKEFVRTELVDSENYRFVSGRQTSGMNMGQIIQIAFELRNITQQAIDDASSDDSDDADDKTLEQRKEMANWQRFCKDKIEKIEKVWNRKLDEKQKEEEEDKGDEADEFEAKLKRMEQRENHIGEILANMPNRRRDNVQHAKGGSFVQVSVPDKDIAEAAKKAEEQRAKDDSDRKQKEANLFNQNQYWKVPDQYDLDELLAEQDDEAQTKPLSVQVQSSERSGFDPESPIFAAIKTEDVPDDVDAKPQEEQKSEQKEPLAAGELEQASATGDAQTQE